LSRTSSGWVSGRICVGVKFLKLIASGIKDYWKLKAINSIGLELPPQERDQFIAALVDKQEIKELLLRKAHV